MKEITARQREVLQYIKSYVANHKFPPTIREISERFAISVKGAYDHVKALEKKSYIRSNNNRSRSIEVLEIDSETSEQVARIPIIGNVAAGLPLFAEENYDGVVQIPFEYVRKGKHFALHVRGDSMRDVGIMDGDVAVILQQNTAENGDIVVAMVEDAVTLKRFYKEKNRVRLKAENPAFPPIYAQNVRILGKLAHLIRSYE
ncbi:MAG TPA: transcriptional repressor LexA [Spirochaetia bacterium]|nr:transcriptional repressor LexA [Spirochaetia bacterium]